MTCKICQHWCGNWFGLNAIRNSDGIPIPTNHHPNCPHYNDSLIEVWKATDGNSSYYQEVGKEAVLCAADLNELRGLSFTKEKMHREIFENLPEFVGF